jgi:hypothetical protein
MTGTKNREKTPAESVENAADAALIPEPFTPLILWYHGLGRIFSWKSGIFKYAARMFTDPYGVTTYGTPK